MAACTTPFFSSLLFVAELTSSIPGCAMISPFHFRRSRTIGLLFFNSSLDGSNFHFTSLKRIHRRNAVFTTNSFYIFLLSLEVNHLSTRKLGSLSSDSHAWAQIIIQGCFGFRITEMEVDGKDRVGSHPQSSFLNHPPFLGVERSPNLVSSNQNSLSNGISPA